MSPPRSVGFSAGRGIVEPEDLPCDTENGQLLCRSDRPGRGPGGTQPRELKQPVEKKVTSYPVLVFG